MNESLIFYYATYGLYAVAALSLYLMLIAPAPYGRYHTNSLGPTLPYRWGFALKESPGFVFFIVIYGLGDSSTTISAMVMAGLWLLHYFNRSFIMPLVLMKPKGKRMSWAVCVVGFLTNAFIASISARWVSQYGNYSDHWIQEPHFILGVCIFCAGMFINVKYDLRLLEMRAKKNKGYSLPFGGLFDKVTSPNYLGEVIEWCGWAVLTWSSVGIAIALCAAAHLIPRAYSHRMWYRRKSTDFPSQRKAIIPKVF